MKHFYVLPVVLSIGCATSHQAFVSAKPVSERAKHSTEEVTPNLPTQSLDIKPLSPTYNNLKRHSPEQIIEEANREAKKEPDEGGFVNANMIYDWDPSTLYQVYAAPNRVSLISLEPGEKILAVHSGDTVRWTIGSSTSGIGQYHLTIKPHRADISTNVLVMTDRRVYNLEARAHVHQNGYMANISWRYPGESSLVLNSESVEHADPISQLNIDSLNTNYTFIASKIPVWMPIRVFDDGQKTYIEFSKTLAAFQAPGLFVLSESAERELINYRVLDRYYIIDRLIERAELRIGDKGAESVGIERL